MTCFDSRIAGEKTSGGGGGVGSGLCTECCMKSWSKDVLTEKMGCSK